MAAFPIWHCGAGSMMRISSFQNRSVSMAGAFGMRGNSPHGIAPAVIPMGRRRECVLPKHYDAAPDQRSGLRFRRRHDDGPRHPHVQAPDQRSYLRRAWGPFTWWGPLGQWWLIATDNDHEHVQ